MDPVNQQVDDVTRQMNEPLKQQAEAELAKLQVPEPEFGAKDIAAAKEAFSAENMKPMDEALARATGLSATEPVVDAAPVEQPTKGMGDRVSELESVVAKISDAASGVRIEALESNVAMILRRLQHHGVTSE
jgi:hypothetical protein